MRKEGVFVICTKMEYLNLYFVNQVLILSEMFTVYLLCPLDDMKYREPYKNRENIVFIDLDVGRKLSILKDIKTFFNLAKLIHLFKPVLVQSVMPKAGFMAMTVAKFMGVNSRVHIFTGQVWANSEGAKRLLLKMADRLIAMCASRVLTDSASQTAFLIDNKIVSQSKVGFLGYGSISGVDLLRFSVAKRMEFQKARKTIDFSCVFLGRLTKGKGFHHILNVFEKLGSTHQNIKLLVAGVDEEGFLQRIKDINCRFSNVEFLGYVDKPERILERSDLLLLPSYREGFGSVVIEAGAMGVPCIGTKIYGLSDSIIDGVTGVKIDVGDEEDLFVSIVNLMQDKDKYEVLSENCRKFAFERFDSEKVKDHWRQFYSRYLVNHDD